MKSMRRIIKNVILLFIFTAVNTNALAVIKITFWHAMAGKNASIVEQLIKNFNDQQKDYEIVPYYKGNYNETLTTTIAAFRAHTQPDIVQVFEIGTSTMAFPKGAIVPVHQLMKQAGIELKNNIFLPAISSYYSDAKGRLLAMPFNSSSPALFINQDAFVKAGLDPQKAPKTWPQLHDYAEKLLAAGYHCGFTSSWPSWIHLENFSAWHNLPFATQNNGYDSLNVKVNFNNPVVTHHITEFAKWQKHNIFVYGGRGNNPTALFTSAYCPMMTGSSGLAASLKKNTSFAVTIDAIPYWPQFKGVPQNTIIGGASLWVMQGKPKSHYFGVAKFFKYLTRADVQAKWHNDTGYFPLTKAGFELAKKQGFYRDHPGMLNVIHELIDKSPTANSRGIRLGNFMQIRRINDQALEAAWSHRKSVQQALQDAITEDNRLLEQFRKNVS